MVATTTIINTEQEADSRANDAQTLSKSELQERLPEGKRQFFIMDFGSIAGDSQNTLYPAIIKPKRLRSNRTRNFLLEDYVPFRFAVGRARAYILQWLGIQGFNSASDLPNIRFLREGSYTKLKKGATTSTANPYENWDPDSSGILIRTGKAFRVQPAGYITQTGINASNVSIKGPVQIRVPTIVSANQFHAWLQGSSQIGSTQRRLIQALVLAGGKSVPIANGGEQVESNADGAD